jgi:hypothetical protein
MSWPQVVGDDTALQSTEYAVRSRRTGDGDTSPETGDAHGDEST